MSTGSLLGGLAILGATVVAGLLLLIGWWMHYVRKSLYWMPLTASLFLAVPLFLIFITLTVALIIKLGIGECDIVACFDIFACAVIAGDVVLLRRPMDGTTR